MDWNNDGKKDLLTGENSGNIRLYLNRGTDQNPSFDGYTMVQCGGITFDAGSYSNPYVTDWNNDGLFDLLCGESSGYVWLLINTGKPGSPLFETKEYVKNGAANLKVYGVSAPSMGDFNRDGKPDLIVGETMGTLYYYANQGTAEKPLFNGYTLLKAGIGTVDVGYYSRPFLADWDGDTVLDVLCGDNTGYVWLFQGMGPLSLSQNYIPDSAGAIINFTLNAGAANANRKYIILGSVTGTEPGTPLPGGYVTLPLNWDLFTDLTLMLTNSPVFFNFMGKLDAKGTSVGRLTAPSNTGYLGQNLYFAYLLASPYNYVSNPAVIEIVP